LDIQHRQANLRCLVILPLVEYAKTAAPAKFQHVRLAKRALEIQLRFAAILRAAKRVLWPIVNNLRRHRQPPQQLQ
jgi:hypothetical protein